MKTTRDHDKTDGKMKIKHVSNKPCRGVISVEEVKKAINLSSVGAVYNVNK